MPPLPLTETHLVTLIAMNVLLHLFKTKTVFYRVHRALYHSLATFREETFLNVHHAQMSTFVIEVYLWYIGFVLVFNWSLH